MIGKLVALSVAALVIGSLQFPLQAQARPDECGPQSLTHHSDDDEDDDYHWPTATSICGNQDYRVDQRTGRKVENGRRNMNHD
jgi:hypothetical protein